MTTCIAAYTNFLPFLPTYYLTFVAKLSMPANNLASMPLIVAYLPSYNNIGFFLKDLYY